MQALGQSRQLQASPGRHRHLALRRGIPRRHGIAGSSGNSTQPASALQSTEARLLEEVLGELRTLNGRVSKLNKSVQRLETRVSDLYEFTSLPIIGAHFTTEFAESTEIRCAANLVDHILSLALNLDLPALKQRSVLISILEDYVLKDRAGLRAAVKSLIDEACDEAGVCMVALPSSFASCSWDDIRSCLTELQLGYSSSGKDDDRINNLLRLVDALETGMPPKPLPGFIEMATAMAGGFCSSRIALDCRGRIDVRDTYIEFHIGAFKAPTDGLPETRTALKRAAALFVWAYRVLEPHIHTHTAGSTERDVEAIGYAFMVGKVAPQDALLKLYDDFTVDMAGRRMPGEIAYRYFSVRPTGLHEHYAKS